MAIVIKMSNDPALLVTFTRPLSAVRMSRSTKTKTVRLPPMGMLLLAGVTIIQLAPGCSVTSSGSPQPSPVRTKLWLRVLPSYISSASLAVIE
jgi:hypothetical protein